MRTLRCENCKAIFNSDQQSCPFCGAEIFLTKNENDVEAVGESKIDDGLKKKKKPILKWAVIGIVGFVIVMALLPNGPDNSQRRFGEHKPNTGIPGSHYANPNDVRQAKKLLEQLPPACKKSNARALPDGTVSIRIRCSSRDKAMDGEVTIKDGIVTNVY